MNPCKPAGLKLKQLIWTVAIFEESVHSNFITLLALFQLSVNWLGFFKSKV